MDSNLSIKSGEETENPNQAIENHDQILKPAATENAKNSLLPTNRSVKQYTSGIDRTMKAIRDLLEAPAAAAITETATQSAFDKMDDCHLASPVNRAVQKLKDSVIPIAHDEARKIQDSLKAVLATTILASGYLIDREKTDTDARKVSWASTDTVVSSNLSRTESEDDLVAAKMCSKSFHDVKSAQWLNTPFEHVRNVPESPILGSRLNIPDDFKELYANSFVNGNDFLAMCLNAQTKACALPESPPPLLGKTVETTTMHIWYFVLLEEFTHVFRRKLHASKVSQIPKISHKDLNEAQPEDTEDEKAFQNERNAHCRAIMDCYRISWELGQDPDSHGYVFVDNRQPNHEIARLSILEARSKADFPGKRNWKTGDPLHSEYRRKFKLFDAALVNIIMNSEEHCWLIGIRQAINRGAGTFKENWMRDIRNDFERRWALLKKYDKQRTEDTSRTSSR